MPSAIEERIVRSETDLQTQTIMAGVIANVNANYYHFVWSVWQASCGIFCNKTSLLEYGFRRTEGRRASPAGASCAPLRGARRLGNPVWPCGATVSAPVRPLPRAAAAW